MSRRRAFSSDDDSLDLLLDTVSNVFGGVMFLTLLAALLILTRGAETVIPTEIEQPLITDTTDARLIELETRQAAAAIEAQQKTIERLDPDGTMADKAERLESIRQTLAVARRHKRWTGSAVADRQQELDDQQTEQSELEQQIEELKEVIAEKMKQVNESRADSERTVLFRPLSSTQTNEAVVILRYGRWYMLYAGPHGDLNRRDFFILQTKDSVTSVTPKPHRGHAVTDESLAKMIDQLKRSFSPRRFHVTIAVWEDSFAEFNPMKDALSAAGYRYRTLTCDGSSRLTNHAAVDPFVQ